MEVELLIFGILGRQNAFFYVVGNGVDDSFSVENRARMEFIGTGRWKEILRLRKMGRGQFLRVIGAKEKVSFFYYLVTLLPMNIILTYCLKKK